MSSAKVQEMMDTLRNELDNNRKEWVFDEQPIHHVYDVDNKLVVELEDHSQIHIIVVEQQMGDYRRCPFCEEMKPGWPNSWRNLADSPGTQYGCGDCVKKEG